MAKVDDDVKAALFQLLGMPRSPEMMKRTVKVDGVSHRIHVAVELLDKAHRLNELETLWRTLSDSERRFIRAHITNTPCFQWTFQPPPLSGTTELLLHAQDGTLEQFDCNFDQLIAVKGYRCLAVHYALRAGNVRNVASLIARGAAVAPYETPGGQLKVAKWAKIPPRAFFEALVGKNPPVNSLAAALLAFSVTQRQMLLREVELVRRVCQKYAHDDVLFVFMVLMVGSYKWAPRPSDLKDFVDGRASAPPDPRTGELCCYHALLLASFFAGFLDKEQLSRVLTSAHVGFVEYSGGPGSFAVAVEEAKAQGGTWYFQDADNNLTDSSGNAAEMETIKAAANRRLYDALGCASLTPLLAPPPETTLFCCLDGGFRCHLSLYHEKTGNVVELLAGSSVMCHPLSTALSSYRTPRCSLSGRLVVWDVYTADVSLLTSPTGTPTSQKKKKKKKKKPHTAKKGAHFTPEDLGGKPAAAAEKKRFPKMAVREACPVAFLDDESNSILSGSHDNTLKIWDVETGECTKTLNGHTDVVYCCAVSRLGKWVLSGSSDKTLKIWDVETGECTKTLKGHIHWVTCCAVSRLGKWVLSGSTDQTLKIWDVETGECTQTLNGHTREVRCCAVSGLGKWVLSGAAYPDNTLKIWDVETGECTKTLEGHTCSVTCCAVSRLGKCVETGECERELRQDAQDLGRRDRRVQKDVERLQ